MTTTEHVFYRKPEGIVEVGPEMSPEQVAQAQRNWEAIHVHPQARGEKITTFTGRQYAPEPQVTMPSPEQILLAQLMDIHPEVGVWALELFQQGYDAIAVRNRLGSIMNTLERN